MTEGVDNRVVGGRCLGDHEGYHRGEGGQYLPVPGVADAYQSHDGVRAPCTYI